VEKKAELDADPQATSSKWVGRRKTTNPDAPIVHCTQKHGDVFDTVADLGRRYEHVIIDAGGRDSEELRTAMVAAHKLYVPLRPSQPDIETSVHVNRLVKMAKGINRGLEASVIITMAPTNPFIKETQEARELLRELPELDLVNVFIRERKVFRDAMASGLGVVEMGNGKGKAEMQLLGQAIFQ
jgi:chromosome partitioning protein